MLRDNVGDWGGNVGHDWSFQETQLQVGQSCHGHDKDMKERTVFGRAFPHATMHLCLFQAPDHVTGARPGV